MTFVRLAGGWVCVRIGGVLAALTMFISPATAAEHSHRGLIWGIVLLASGLAHLAFRHFYARREAAVQKARRETAISPVRRAWIWPTDERSNLIIGTSISAIMILGGVVVLALSV